MTAPLVIPTPGSSLTTVRYFGPLDPYHYTVDNRPLTDLDANTQTVLEEPIDAVFRAVALSTTNSPLANGSLYQPSSLGVIKGLTVSSPSAGTVTIAPGALYVRDNVNSSTSISVVKMFSMLSSQTLSTPAPGVVGQSINYLVQGKISYLDLSTMATSNFPFVSTTNDSLPGLLANGELKISVIAGNGAATGSQTTPSPDAGAYPIFVVTVANSGAITVAMANNAPDIVGLNRQLPLAAASSNPAGTTSLAGTTLFQFADSATSSVTALIPLTDPNLNPYKPIKFTLTLASSVANDNASFQVQYLALGAGDLTSTSTTAATAETVAVPSTANSTFVYTTTTGSIAPTVFSGFNGSNVWSVTKRRLFIQISRLGSAGSDTNTGAITLLDVTATQ